MTDFAICDGLGMRICGSCRRNIDVNGADPDHPHRNHINPLANVERGTCGDWTAIPQAAINESHERL